MTDGGLPYSKHESVGAGTGERFVSRKIYLCTSGSCGSPKRTVYLRYASEFRNCDQVDSPGCYSINPLLTAERTVFHADSNRYIETRSFDYDGLGRFDNRQTVTSFPESPSTQVTTDYVGGSIRPIDSATGYVDPGTPSTYLPSPGAPWWLGKYSAITTSRGGESWRTLYSFDAQGGLLCQRRLVGASPSPEDQTVVLGRNSSGLPTSETVSGGDGANLGEGACAVASTTANGQKYILSHEYQHHQLSRTHIAGFPNRYAAAIDRNTGLPSAVSNEADQATTLTFDLQGRLTFVSPTSDLEEAATSWEYLLEDTNLPIQVMRRLDRSGNALVRVQTVHDGFGRKIQEITRQPLGQGSHADTDVRLEYDGAGHLVNRTTRRSNSLVVRPAWKYSNFDAFGRPTTVERPDGRTETRNYLGVRQVASTVSVQVSESGTEGRTTTSTYDTAGQPVKVATSEHTTSFDYDPYGRMTSASRNVGGSTQVRTYAWDGRGFLAGENLPEVTTTYERDAFGLVRRFTDGAHDLATLYDGDGRPTSVRLTQGSQVWKSWIYGTTNEGSGSSTNYSKGRLIEARRHNETSTGAIEIRETYDYFGGGWAGPSRVTTQVVYPDLSGDVRFGAAFRLGVGRDLLGNITSLGYPDCLASPSAPSRKLCDDGDDGPAAVHAVSYGHNQGLQVSAISNLGPSATFGYLDNHQLGRVDHGNGVTGVYSQGSGGLVRPRRRAFYRGHGTANQETLFDTGLYAFDGAGNIGSIGADLYTYDGAGRLRSGTVKSVAPWAREDYTYDRADNLVSATQNSGFALSYDVDLATNRYTGAGGSNDLSYDGAGNLVALGLYSPGSPIYEMEYDPANMQTVFQLNPAAADDRLQRWESVYGPGDLRIATIETHTGDQYWTLRGPGSEILREYRMESSGQGQGEDWTHEQDLVHGAEGLFATRQKNGTERYFHSDHLGTVRLLTTANGNALSQHHFYPFGQELSRTTPGALLVDGFESGTLDAWGGKADELSVKYTGHSRDRHGFSDYMLGRTCLFPLRRFASVDRGRDGWNLYAYTRNNPIKFIDPNGEAALAAHLRQPDYERNAKFRQAFKADLKSRLPFIGGPVGNLVDSLVLSQIFPASPQEYVDNVNAAMIGMGTPLGGAVGPIIKAAPRSLRSRQMPMEMTGSRIKKMVKAMKKGLFDWAQAGAIQIAERDGVRIIIDGHHRVAAAARAGIDEVPVQVHKVSDETWQILLEQADEAAGR